MPDGAIVIFSAHGVSQAVRQEAKDRQLKVFDATCPLVTKVHMQVARASRKDESDFDRTQRPSRSGRHNGAVQKRGRWYFLN